MSTATENAASTAPVEIPTLGALEDQVLGQFSVLVERTLSTPSALTSQLLDQGVEAVYEGLQVPFGAIQDTPPNHQISGLEGSLANKDLVIGSPNLTREQLRQLIPDFGNEIVKAHTRWEAQRYDWARMTDVQQRGSVPPTERPIFAWTCPRGTRMQFEFSFRQTGTTQEIEIGLVKFVRRLKNPPEQNGSYDKPPSGLDLIQAVIEDHKKGTDKFRNILDY